MPFYVLIIALTALISCNNVTQERENEPEIKLESKIGQMIMVGFRGMTIDDTHWVVRDIRDHNIGGVILFDYDVPNREPVRNIESPEQVKILTSTLQSINDIPLFISVDQEGGRVNRLKERFGFPPMPGHEQLGEINNPEKTRNIVGKMASVLSESGFSVNFAPVVDLNINTENPIIGKLGRSFSADHKIVSKHARIFIEEHRNNGVIAAAKHFPGHGSTWNDSHYGMADVTDTWIEDELKPYRYLIDSVNVDVIMSAHIVNRNWNAEHPATLSYEVMTTMLRDELGFQGVLVSDDMQMGAVTEYYGLEQAVTLAVNAGIDILIFANNSVYDSEITQKVIDIIKKGVENGVIPRERIEESYKRIMNLKNERL
jgi:beta-N-acetylhexosaminidase